MIRKNRGITLLETVISLGLISIFSLIIFPTLRISNRLNESISEKGLRDREITRVLNIVERAIEKSSPLPIEYLGDGNIRNGVEVIVENRVLTGQINISTLENVSTKGNLLFLEYPRSNGKTIINSILFFQFIHNGLMVMEGRLFGDRIRIVDSLTLLDRVVGEFERKRSGVVIRLEILRGDNSKEKVVRYESFRVYH